MLPEDRNSPYPRYGVGAQYVSSSALGAITKYHTLGGIKNRILFLTVPEAGKSKIKVLANSISGEDLFPGSWMTAFLLCPYMMEGPRDLSRIPFMQALILFSKAPPLITSLKLHFLIPS